MEPTRAHPSWRVRGADLLLAAPLLLSGWILHEGTFGRALFLLALVLGFAAARAEHGRLLRSPMPLTRWALYGYMTAFGVPTLFRLPPWFAVSVLTWILAAGWLGWWWQGQRMPGLLVAGGLLTAVLLPLPHVTEFIGSPERPGYVPVMASAAMLVIVASQLYLVTSHLRSRLSPREQAREA